MEITANTVQSVVQNENVIFTDTLIPGNNSIVHRSDSGLVKIRGLSNCQCRARFKVFFSGNIAVPTGGTIPSVISLALSIDGEPVSVTTMSATPSGVNNYFNVASSTYIDVPTNCCSTVAVTNISTQTIEVQNANLIVERVV